MGEDGGGYVHDPAAFGSDDPADRGGEDDDSSDGDAERRVVRNATTAGLEPEAGAVDAAGRTDRSDREFGRRGWILVGVIAFAFVVCPLAILLWPPGFGYRFALLILPLVPAVLLAITAVWATTRP